MKSGTSIIAAAVFAFVAMSTVPMIAVAQSGIDPRCKDMRDKIGCTCALQNGGQLGASKNWTYPSRNINEFAACRGRMGGKG